jgi:phosphoenolpyruvate carboxykinase (ATP)
MIDTDTKSISLNNLGINSSTIHYQLSSNELHSITLKKNQGKESSLGAIAINTGEFTGRSPMDRFIVKDSITKDEIWWGDINIPFSTDNFDKLYDKVVSNLS